MKWLVFIIAVLASYPVGWWLRGRPSARAAVWSLCGFLPFFRPLEMALVPFGERPGDTFGLEVGVLDWLALSLFLAQRRTSRRLPNGVVLALYLLVAVASVTQAEWALGAFGYVWKLGRMYFLYAVICRSGDERRVTSGLLRGMMLGIVYELGWALWQHFGLAMPRVTGTFVHQNTLGMMVNLAVMAPVALEVAGRGSRLTRLAVIAAVPVCILTISRGALLFFGGGVVLVYLASATRAFTWRKAKLGLVGLALAAVVVPLALAELGSRPEVERVESMETRAQFERAASLMLQEHPLGIGPNHFTLRLLTSYGERAGVDWTQRLAIVHDVYTLTAAEMGYAGVVALALLFVAPLLTAVRAIRRAGRDPRGDLLVGLAVTLAVFYAHGLFEWAWRQTPVSYLYWMIVAVTESVARQLRAERATRRHADASTVRPSAAAAVLAPVGA